MHFTLTVACLFCFLISLGKAAESEKIQDTQQFCLLNAYYFSVHNWGNRCDVDHMISICANAHKRLQERRCVSVLWSNTPCEQTGRNIPYPPALEILPSFLCLPVREFFYYCWNIDTPKKRIVSMRGDLKWGKRTEKNAILQAHLRYSHVLRQIPNENPHGGDRSCYLIKTL